jgi:hypothetical protein
MIRDDVETAMQKFRDGIAGCTNEHLKADMERVLARLTAAAPAAQPQAQDAAAEPAANSAIILGAYRDSLDS